MLPADGPFCGVAKFKKKIMLHVYMYICSMISGSGFIRVHEIYTLPQEVVFVKWIAWGISADKRFSSTEINQQKIISLTFSIIKKLCKYKFKKKIEK